MLASLGLQTEESFAKTRFLFLVKAKELVVEATLLIPIHLAMQRSSAAGKQTVTAMEYADIGQQASLAAFPKWPLLRMQLSICPTTVTWQNTTSGHQFGH